MKNPIIDSKITREEAIFTKLPKKCPDKITNSLILIDLQYYSFDWKLHEWQMVTHASIAESVQKIFQVILDIKFPIWKVIPISHPKYLKNGLWDDDLSMEDNNCSWFNFREITWWKSLSIHAYWKAFDINPIQNPYFKNWLILPNNAIYDPKAAWTLTSDCSIVKKAIELWFSWWWDWAKTRWYLDYHHFEEPTSKPL